MEHKLITGGEQYLPFARSRIEALKATGLKYASQQFEIDGASIKVRIEPGHEYITLTKEGGGYQFFSTGPALTTIKFQGFDAFRGYAAATGPDGKKPRALGSSVEAGPADVAGNPAWPLVDTLNITSVFPVKNVWQLQGIPEHTYYGRAKGAALLSNTRLVDSWSCARQIEGLSARGGNRRNELLKSGIDVSFDAAPTLGSRGHAPDADWYKRAAYRTVEHPQHTDHNHCV